MIGPVTLLALSKLADTTSIPPEYAEKIMIYHVNPLSEGVIPVDMDTADARGDLFFDYRSKISPIECAEEPKAHDCDNGEVTANDLVITKLVLEVDNRYGAYGRCNICANGTAGSSGSCTPEQEGEYICSCGGRSFEPCPAAVGKEDLYVKHMGQCSSRSEDWECWKANMGKKTGGYWYSTVEAGYCGDGSSPEPAGCTWRVAELSKVVNKTCSDDLIYGALEAKDSAGCFRSCSDSAVGPRRNTSSPCFIGCFYSTLLGPDAASQSFQNTSGMPIEDMVSMWEDSLTNCPDIRPEVDPRLGVALPSFRTPSGVVVV